MIPPPPRSTLFPYTTLFRSQTSHSYASSQSHCSAIQTSAGVPRSTARSEEHTSELQSLTNLVCRLLLEKKKKKKKKKNIKQYNKKQNVHATFKTNAYISCMH